MGVIDWSTCANNNILNSYIPIFITTVADTLFSKKKLILNDKTILDWWVNPRDTSHKYIIEGSPYDSAVTVSNSIVSFWIVSDIGDSFLKPVFMLD